MSLYLDVNFGMSNMIGSKAWQAIQPVFVLYNGGEIHGLTLNMSFQCVIFWTKPLGSGRSETVGDRVRMDAVLADWKDQ